MSNNIPWPFIGSGNCEVDPLVATAPLKKPETQASLPLAIHAPDSIFSHMTEPMNRFSWVNELSTAVYLGSKGVQGFHTAAFDVLNCKLASAKLAVQVHPLCAERRLLFYTRACSVQP